MLRTSFRIFLSVLLWTVSPWATEIQAATVEEVKALLENYQKASNQQRYPQARRLYQIFQQQDIFLEEVPTLRADMPKEALDLLVWYGAERYCYATSYYAEGLDYVERALRLALKGHRLHAPLLCDKGYMLFKQGKLAEAITTEHEAEKAAKAVNDLMSLSRAYLYIAIVNHVDRQPEAAKKMVARAIEADRQMGVNRQTHNTLGIACEIYSVAGYLKEADPKQKVLDMQAGVRYGWQAVEAARQIGDSAAVANHLSQLSYTYDCMKEHERGIQMADQAIRLVNQAEVTDRNLLALTLEYKAYNQIDMGRHRDAVATMRQALALQKEIGNMRSYCTDLRTLAEALTPIDSAEALKVLAENTQMHDSIFIGDTREKISEVNAAVGNEELEAERQRHARMNTWLTIGITLLVLFLAALVLYLWHLRRQHLRMQELLQQKEQEARQTGATQQTDSDPDQQFLTKVNDLILRLMPEGKANIEHVSGALNISPSQFRRRIQHVTGLTPANYILTIRMDEAKKLLASYPDFTMSAIAARCGFADNAHFTHAFKRVFHCSPLEYVNSRKES